MVSRSLIAILTVSTLAGCANPVSVTGPRHTSEKPAFDGTGWFGSGSRVESDSTSASNGATTSTATATGIGWFGSRS
jgi:hypothetical protein